VRTPTSATFPVLPGLKLQALGQRVVHARKVRGLTQRDLAAMVGVSLSSVLALEKGEPGVAIGTLARVLEAMDLLAELDQLLVPERDPAYTSYAMARLTGRPS
jgi:transcriptional regulator with XRE-family HTH domain